MKILHGNGTTATRESIDVGPGPASYIIKERLYAQEPYGPTDDEPDGGKRTLLYRVGQVVSEADLAAVFAAAATPGPPTAGGPLPIVRTEVYAGALEDYPDDSVIPYGPANLADGSDSTGIRLSSAWAGDWWTVYDSAALAGCDSITVTAKYRNVSGSLGKPELGFMDGPALGGNGFGELIDLYLIGDTLTAGEVVEMTWVLDEAWVASHITNITSSDDYVWLDSESYTWAGVRDALMSKPEFSLHLMLAAGGTHETDLLELTVQPG